MKTIGFIDYYLSEWHANNYPAWIQAASKEMGEEFVVKYAWGEKASEVDGKSNEDWCKEMGVELCSSIEEVCEKSDYIIVLAPSNPEKHLEYAKKVLPFAKRTYIDKTFAPDYKTAKEIFDLSEQYNAPFFTTSALRYATELNEFIGANDVITTGGGSNIEEYCIHQVEMMVKLLQAKPLRVKVQKLANNQYLARVEFEGGKNGSVLFAMGLPFSFCVNAADGHSDSRIVESSFFTLLIKGILQFFEDGVVPFNAEETLAVMKIREKIVEGVKKPDCWLDV